MLGRGPQHSVHQGDVDHRGLVDHEQIAPERALFVAPETAMPGIDIKEAMDGLGFAASALAEPLGRTAGRSR
jgi:hypothetical protein